MKRKLRVGVVFGGRSGEHDVSLASAHSVMKAMDRSKYEIVPMGITRSGSWLLTGNPMAALMGDRGDGQQSTPSLAEVPAAEASSAEAPSAEAPSTGGRELVPGATGGGFPRLDVVFPVLHGPFGEDGTIQGLLELAGLPYVGSGVMASALAMDKIASKAAFAAYGLPQVPYQAVKRKQWENNPDAVIAEIETALRYPLFVKPANLGSSIGISKVRSTAELRTGLAEAARYDRKLVIEEAVPNAREIECSVLGNDDPIASVPGEIIASREFYDYAAKYLDGESQLLIPAPIPPEVAACVREMAVRAFLAIDGAGLARVDFLVNGTSNEVFLNEINTLPGFTTISMYPKLWEATGIPYGELIDRLLELALERHSDRTRSTTTYSSALLLGDEV